MLACRAALTRPSVWPCTVHTETCSRQASTRRQDTILFVILLSAASMQSCCQKQECREDSEEWERAPVNPGSQEQFAAEMLPAGDSECLEQLLHELAAD